MRMTKRIKWVLALGLLIGGGALLVADSAAPLESCDDVATFEKSYVVELSCALTDDDVIERAGTLELEYVQVERLEIGVEYDHNEANDYIGFEDWIIIMNKREELEIEGDELRLLGASFGLNFSQCSDEGGTATIGSLFVEFELHREDADPGFIETFFCRADMNSSGPVECELYKYSTSQNEEEQGSNTLPNCTLTLQEI